MNWKIERMIAAPGLVLALCCLAAAGCNHQQKQAEQQMGRDAVHAAKKLGEAAKKTARQAVGDSKTTAALTFKKSAKAIREGNIVLRVRAALALSERLSGSSISVALVANRVELSGDVVNAQQKVIAQQIAVNTVGNKFAVVNKLHVPATAHPAAKMKK